MCRGSLAVALAGLAVCCLRYPVYGQGDVGGARQLVVERVEVSGEARTRQEVIERYLGLSAGAALRSQDLLTGRQQLENTGFFKGVDVYARPGSEKGRVVVVVEAEEHRWPQYRFEGGHGELDGWYIVPVGFVYDNFSGRGHRLDWKWYVGSHATGTNLHYQHPQVWSGAAALDVDVFSEVRAFPQFVDGTEIREDVSTGGISVRISGQRGQLRHLFGQVRSQRYRPDWHAELDALLHEDLLKTTVTALGVGLQADTRDRRDFPTDGFLGQAVLERAVGAGAGDVSFTRLALEGRWYRRVAERNVVALRAHAGLVSEGAPFFERFYLGGPYSLRKYEWAEATPVGWGTRTLQGQAELRLPFGRQDATGPANTGVLFYDVGGIWLPGELPAPADLHHAMGVGYRRCVRVLGVLRIDLSLPVTPTGGTSDWDAFHLCLALGRAF